MNLQGPLVRQITAEILHHVKNLCIIYIDNLLATIFYCIFESINDSFCFTSSRTSSQILGPRKVILLVPLYTELTRGILTLFRMGLFGAAHGLLPKICHIYPIVKKLGTVLPCLQKILFLLIFLTVFESLKVVLINMVAILIMSAKLATVGLLNLKVF